MNAAPVAAANSRLRKIVRSSIGARARRSISTKSRQQDRAGDEPADRPAGRSSPRCPPRERPSTRPVSPTTNTAVPEQVVAAHARPAWRARAARARAQTEPASAERDVEPEDPVPGDRDERAAEHRPDHEPDRGDHRVRAHREAELLARERVGDQRGGVGEQERAADPLQDPPEDQLRPVGREAGAQRREREDHEAADVGLLAPEQVGQPARGEHQHGRGDHVGEDHPHELEDARVRARARGRAGR